MGKKSTLFILLILFTLSLSAREITAHKGILDARNFDFDHQVLRLKGFWEFYPNQILGPENFKSIEPLKGVRYVWQPSLGIISYKGKEIHCGTLRLIILVKNNFPDSIFYQSGIILSSSTHYINSYKVFEFGHTSCDSNATGVIANKKKIIRGIKISEDPENHIKYFQVIINISNLNNGLPIGIKYIPRIGPERALEKSNIFLVFFQLGVIFFILSLSVLFIFYYLIKKHYKRRTKYIFLTLLAISASIKIVLGNKVYLSPMSVDTYVYIQYLNLIISFFALGNFLYHYNKDFINKRALIIWDIIISLDLIILLLNTYYFHSQIRSLFFSIIFFSFFVLSLFAFLRALHTQSSFLIITLVICFFAAIINLLWYIGIINWFIPEGTAYFIFLMALATEEAVQSEKIIIQNKRLAKRLIDINKHLNKIIIDRTKEIIIKSKKLEIINSKLHTQNLKLLKIQRELTKKNNIIQTQSREIVKSIEYAKNFQAAILPTEKEIDKYLENFIIYEPKYIVSGDFYIFRHYQDSDYIGVFDCTGHGVPGAFLSILSYKIIDEAINYIGLDTMTDIMNHTNKELRKLMSGRENFGDGFEFGIIRIEKNKDNTRKITFWGTRKTPLFFYDSHTGQISRYRLKNPMIGTYSNDFYDLENIEITANKSDMLWLSTDGYIDQANDERRKLGTRRFMKILQTIATEPVHHQKQILINTFQSWKSSEIQIDDVTVIGIRL